MTKTICIILLLLVLAPAAAVSAAGKDKITPEEIIAKHLEAIGPADARAAVKSIFAEGTAIARWLTGGKGQKEGKAVLMSQGDMSLIAMIFGARDYPHDKVAFDGKSVNVSYLNQRTRSELGTFLLNRQVIFKQGLMGGVLSTAWGLRDVASKKPKLEYAGTKKINDREAYQVKYYPSGGSDVSIALFFDKETFLHVRTEYAQVLRPGVSAGPTDSPGQRDVHYKLIEEFGDFSNEGKLKLPHGYRIHLMLDQIEMEWTLALNRFTFNLPLDPKEFHVDTY